MAKQPGTPEKSKDFPLCRALGVLGKEANQKKQGKRKKQGLLGSFARGRCRRGRSEIPIFAVNCCCLPLSFRRSREKRRKRGKMRKKRVKKWEKCVKKGKITLTPSTPTPLRTSQACDRANPYSPPSPEKFRVTQK